MHHGPVQSVAARSALVGIALVLSACHPQAEVCSTADDGWRAPDAQDEWGWPEGTKLDASDAVRLGARAQGKLGATVVRGGDLDGDGTGDLVYTEPGFDGTLHVMYGPPDSGRSAEMPRIAQWGPLLPEVAAVDLDGDGTTELIVADRPSQYPGLLVFAAPEGRLDSSDAIDRISDASLRFNEEGVIYPSVVGDLDGDDRADLAWVGPCADGLCRSTATVRTSSGARALYASNPRALVGTGDVTGDGIEDLLLPMALMDASAVAFFAGPLDGDRWSEDADAIAIATYGDQPAGRLGDVNGDGYLDLAPQEGRIYFGPITEFGHAASVDFALAAGQMVGGDFTGDCQTDVAVRTQRRETDNGWTGVWAGPLEEGSYSPRTADYGFASPAEDSVRGVASAGPGGSQLTVIDDLWGKGETSLLLGFPEGPTAERRGGIYRLTPSAN